MKKIFGFLTACFLTVSLFLPVFSGCAERKEEIESDGFNYFYHSEAEGHVPNPGMGWVGIEETIYYGQVEAGGSGNIPEADIISIESSWAFLEPERDVYDFSLLDKMMDYWKQYGKTFIFRIMTDALSLGFTWEGAPAWLLEDPRCGYEIVSFDVAHPGRINDEYRVANVTSSYYQERLGLFLGKLAERYGNDKSVETVEIRGYGNWGEWHSGYTFDTMYDRVKTLKEIVDVYAGAYASYGKILVVSNTYDPMLLNNYSGNYNAYITASVLDYVFKTPNGTFRRDAVGSNVFKDEYDGRLISDLVRSGKRVPMLTEFYWSAKDMQSASEDGWNFENAINHMLFKGRANSSSVIGYNPYAVADMVDAGQTWALDRGNSKFGYRFVVDESRVNREVAPGDDLSVMIKMSNRGVGRFYFRDYLKYYVTDANGKVVAEKKDGVNDLRNLMLGDGNEYFESISLPQDLSEGEYDLSLAVVDEHGDPHIRLAMEGDAERKIYKIASFTVKNGAGKAAAPEQKLTKEELGEITLDPNSVYTLTFGYTPKFEIENYEFGNYDGYAVRLQSEKGGTNKILLKYQDVSGEYGSKTVTFETYGQSDYKLSIGSDNFGDIEVGDVYLRKENGRGVNFDIATTQTLSSVGNAATVINDGSAIHGKSLLLSGTAWGDEDLAKLEGFKLSPNTTYTVTFNARTTKDVGAGGYFFARLREGTGTRNLLEWYERPDTPYTNKGFTFTTGAADATLYFGCHNRGSFLLDDLTIVQEFDGAISERYDYGFTHNERPGFEDRMSQTETFEGISFLQSNIQWGYYRWGRITTDPRYVIEGNQSFWGKLDVQKLTDWMELFYSNRRFIRFEPGATYRVEFDYRVLKNPEHATTGEPGFFYVMCRSETLGISSDVGYNTFTDERIGEVQHYSRNITIGNATDYKFIFGQFYYGEIIIDNVKFTKL